jgi:hypothetical protein
MRALKGMKTMPRTMRRMAATGKHELMLRRAANHNLHLMTPHGKIFAGRKGRKG